MSQCHYLGKCLSEWEWIFWLWQTESVQSTVGLQEVSYRIFDCLPPSFKLLKSGPLEELIFRPKNNQPTNLFLLFLTPLYSGVNVLSFHSLPFQSWASLFIREIKRRDLTKICLRSRWWFSSVADLIWSAADRWSSTHLWCWKWWALNAWQWVEVIELTWLIYVLH